MTLAPPVSSEAAERPTLSLDGVWSFSFEGATASLRGVEIATPSIWQSAFPELRNAPGVGRYRREVELPADWRGRRVHLVFEGAFHETDVLIDGVRVARHGDGWTTCDVDLTEAVAGKTGFTLGLDVTLPDERGLGVAALGETLAAKQDWYGLQGGVWKSARLEARAPTHLADLTVQTSLGQADGVVTARGSLSAAPTDAALRLILRGGGGVVVETRALLNSRDFDLQLVAPRVAPWSPNAPNLYEVECALEVGGESVDALRRTVGFRRFEARAGRLWLNAEPFLMFGALDQDWRPEQECRPPTPEFLEQRFLNAKAMGLNTLRCHVKIPDKLYFELADRLGVIVWLDMPYGEYLTPRAREAVRRVFHRSVAAHAHHPAICIWTLFNEGWGIDLDDNPDDRRFLSGFFDEAKRAVPEALVVDNSPCFPRNYHVKTDIADFHWYNGFPHQTREFQATANAFAHRAPFLFSPHGDAATTGEEPLICSEFGVWGLPHPRDILEKDGREPWWFESGHDWNLGAGYPHGVETRFRDAGLAAVFGSLDGFVNAAQEFQFRGLKAQIEALRWEPAISGYVITELNDTQWEANGLMDARNNKRRFADRLAGLQTPWLALARAERTAVTIGETFTVETRLAGPVAPPEGVRLRWRLGETQGEISCGESLRLIAPARGGLVELELEARDGARLLSRNVFEFAVVAPLAEAPLLFPIDESAARLLERLGWPGVATDPGAAQVGLATRLTTPVREHILAGRDVLLIANSADALADPDRGLPENDRHNFPRMRLRARDGTPWDGRWMGGFAWRRIDGPWATLPGGAMLDEHWRELAPHFVLTSFLSTGFLGLVDAGIAVGWLHHAAAFVKRTRLGPGRLTVSTFEFGGAAAENPLAPHLLAALASAG